MAPQVTFPAHTQARMAAANAAKQVNGAEQVSGAEQVNNDKQHEVNADKQANASDDQPSAALMNPTLPGEVLGLNVSARQWILESDAKITIGCGSLQAFVPLVKNVNLAMLEYYVPYIVANHKYTLPRGDIILLPANMGLITHRGLKYVVSNMKLEMERGSYVMAHTEEDELEEATCMIRPSRNPVDMIHALNTLRAFGLSEDARFLAMEDGPIMTTLRRRALQWDGTLQALKRFLKTLERQVLEEADHHLLVPAWDVYEERLADSRPKTSGHKA